MPHTTMHGMAVNYNLGQTTGERYSPKRARQGKLLLRKRVSVVGTGKPRSAGLVDLSTLGGCQISATAGVAVPKRTSAVQGSQRCV
jgi:hypothetical protein